MNATDEKESRLPLEGLVVVELGHSVAAPFAGQILGDLGAQVVKVEKADGGDDARSWGPPFLDGTSITYLSLNRNKHSVSVNLKDAAQLERLKHYIGSRADVVLQNLRPGSVEKLALDGPALRRKNDRLIYCNLGAFGRGGPLSGRPGYDPIMQAYGGIMSVTGEEGRPPVRVGVSLVDFGTGMWAVIGILSALHQRTLTGHGCEVDVSLFESALAWMTVHVANYTASGELPARLGSGAVITAPYQAFRTGEGFIMIAAANASAFGKLCEALERPEWADDPRFRTNEDRIRNKRDLEQLIEAVLAGASAREWVERLEAAGVACGPLQDVAQVLASPQTLALGILQNSGAGPMRTVGVPISFDGARPGVRLEPAEHGKHTHEILGKY